MSKSILIQGKPATGKTVSLRNLDPKKTFWVNTDGKFDAWKGFSKAYSKEAKNYIKTKDSDTILKVMEQISEKQSQFKYIVVDTINAVMVNMELKAKTNGFVKYVDIADFGYNIIDLANNLRDDLYIIMLGHAGESEDGIVNLITNGKKLEKINLPAYCSIVLTTKNEEGKYNYIIRSENSTSRFPFGYFEGVNEIDNDIMLVLKELEDE